MSIINTVSGQAPASSLSCPAILILAKVISQEINPEYSLAGLILKVKLQYYGHLMGRADSLEKTLLLGRIEGRRRRGQERMTRWMATPTQWMWPWASSWRWVKDREACLACCSPWGHKESDMTEGLKNNKILLLEFQPQGMTHQSLYLSSRRAATTCLSLNKER